MSAVNFHLAEQELLREIRAVIPQQVKIYLVGGAVRDLLCGRKPHDFDFVLPSEVKVIPLARNFAKKIRADFYPLDIERDTGRVILTRAGGERMFLDFAQVRGEDIVSDLFLRDFTINAMAIDLDQPDRLVDPLGGAKDLFEKTLRVCTDRSLVDDPVRVLRAIRLAVNYQLKMDPETRQLIRQAAPKINEVSPERQRDEIFHLLECAKPDVAIRTLDTLGLLSEVFPQLENLKDITQSEPHVLDVWKHTLSVVQNLQQLLFITGLGSDLESKANITSGWISLKLGRFRQNISDHYAEKLNPDRSIQGLLFLAALYHDAGKAAKKFVDNQGQIHFYQHEQISREIVELRARALHLSNQEIERVSTIVAGHMRPFSLRVTGAPLTRRAIYRYWRDLKQAGVDICLLSLADMLGTYGSTLQQDQLSSHLEVVRTLLEAWWEQRLERVDPPVLLDGHRVMQTFGLKPGPTIGRVLEAVREAQAEGQVLNLEQALVFVEAWLKNEPPRDG